MKSASNESAPLWAPSASLKNLRARADYDAQLIAALRQGLPDCAGVALGVDRLLMLLLEAPELAAVLAFDDARA